ncbi:hypothetical protein LCGC14_1137650 [marine sediment metagenome]|uniref:Uncharacterized protein n=1 Tax=marine sediment metagenome TaxID=412755 RepID=A0A0F9M451_9ZZZZ
MAMREGFDLFRRVGRRCFFQRGIFGDKWARTHVLPDTLGHHICLLLGHSRSGYTTDDSPPRTICARCNGEVKP